MFFKILSIVKISDLIDVSLFIISKKKKAFYIGSTKNNNLGDDAILYVAKKMLSKYCILDLGYQMSPFLKLIIKKKLLNLILLFLVEVL